MRSPEPCGRCSQRGAVVTLSPDGCTILALICPTCQGTGFGNYSPPNRTGKLDPSKVAAFVNKMGEIMKASVAELLLTDPAEAKRRQGATPDLQIAMAALRVVEPDLLEIDFKPTLRLYLNAAHALDAEFPEPLPPKRPEAVPPEPKDPWSSDDESWRS